MRARKVQAAFLLLFLLLTAAPVPAAENQVEEKTYLQAVQLFNQHDWDGARRVFSEFLRSYPRSQWVYAARLRLADLENNPAAAEKAYREVADQAGNSEWGQDARWGLANTLFTLGKYTEASTLLITIGQSGDPRRCQALYLAGRCQVALQNYKSAKTLFSQIQESYADSPWAGPALAGLADANAGTRNVDAALADYEHYLKKYPEGELADYVREQRDKLRQRLAPPAETGRTENTSLVPSAGETAKPVKAAGPEESFTVQVGAFSKPEYAATLVKRLRQKGFNAYILAGRSGAELFHPVRVGNYTQREFAEDIAAKLEKKEKLPTLVMPYEGGSGGGHKDRLQNN